jgi:predicted unusual protein kinase regulating ubiquinone biosynthesis (AarF/ABC1/UbiB family)
LSDGRPGLIDFGQVKQISGRNRETLCKTMIALADRKRDGDDEDGLTPEDMELAGKMAIELGVEIKPTAQKEAAAAVALWLFDGTVKKLPGGYDMGELSPNSPVKELKSFPQDLVLVGRSTILIKGIAARLGITHSLAAHWAPIARQVLANDYSQHDMTRDGGSSKVRFRDVLRTLRQWGKGRATGLVRRLPSPIRSRIAAYIVRRQERQARKALTTRRRQRLR